MFRREVKNIKELILKNLREQGLETPLLQKRLMEAWPTVAGEMIARYTDGVSIRNQTLYVHLTNPALRQDLSMQRSDYVKRLNAYVGSQVIAGIRFVSRDFRNLLKIKADAEHGGSPSVFGEEAVVVAATATQTASGCIEGEDRHENDVDLRMVGISLAYRFHDMEGPFAEVMNVRIAAQFHGFAVNHLR